LLPSIAKLLKTTNEVVFFPPYRQKTSADTDSSVKQFKQVYLRFVCWFLIRPGFLKMTERTKRKLG